MASCLVVQHLAPEGPYAIADAMRRAGVSVEVCALYDGQSLPESIAGFDGLVVMGGPMSAYLDDGFPSRRAELALLAEAMKSGVPALGVCLGAQLLALAAGGRVFPGANGPEIGWAPVTLAESAASDPLLSDLPSALEVLHWHGDTFELPPGAVSLAASERYAMQAFRVDGAAWGLQFHVEIDATAVENFVVAFGDDARKAGTPPESILRATPRVLATLAPARDRVLDRFATLVASHDREAAYPLA